jgi:putative transposase
MILFFAGFFLFLCSFFRSRCNLGLEILALRQQVSVLNRKHPHPRLRAGDRLFWVFLHRLWSGWSNALIVVKPETVVAWHRTGFRLFWRFRSRSKNRGRPQITAQIRSAIQKLKRDSPATRSVSNKPDSSANLISFPRIGGLHHRYDWQQAA